MMAVMVLNFVGAKLLFQLLESGGGGRFCSISWLKIGTCIVKLQGDTKPVLTIPHLQ